MSIFQLVAGTISSSNNGGGGGSFGYPDPGSGVYKSVWAGSEFWGIQGTPYDPGGGVASVDLPQMGSWRRTARNGYWSNGGNDNPGLFNNPETDARYDYYGGFGDQERNDGYALEWKGYFKPPLTSTYNFLTDSDDICMFWIGIAALNPDSNPALCHSNNGSHLNNNSVSLTADTWYPIRMRYQEWGGGERCQVFAQTTGTSNTLWAMSQYQTGMCWNGYTAGY